MDLRTIFLTTVVALTICSCDHHDPAADMAEVRRIVIHEDMPDMDTSTIRVALVHPEVAIVSNLRSVRQQTGDTLRIPQKWVFVRENGRWQLRMRD